MTTAEAQEQWDAALAARNDAFTALNAADTYLSNATEALLESAGRGSGFQFRHANQTWRVSRVATTSGGMVVCEPRVKDGSARAFNRGPRSFFVELIMNAEALS